jgi:hypothetical protein
MKLLGGSGQSAAESDVAPACKNSSSGRVVAQPITFEGLELDASCFRRTCLLALAALAGMKPQVIDWIMHRVAHFSHTLQDADHLVESARLHAFQIIQQLYECRTPDGMLHCRRSSQVNGAKLVLEGRAELSLDLPPPPVGLAPDQQQQLDALRDQFASNYRRRLFLNASKEEAADAIGAFSWSVRKFWRKFDGGSGCAKKKKWSRGFKPKGGPMLSDSLIVLLQAVVAASVVRYFGSIAQLASAE